MHFQDHRYRDVTIPFSESNLDWVEKASRWYCSFFQGILFYHHNNFEIRVWLKEPDEVLFTSENIDLDRLERKELAGLQMQVSALKQAAEKLSPQLDFIDFSWYRVLPGYRILFPVNLQSNSEKKAGDTGSIHQEPLFCKRFHRRAGGDDHGTYIKGVAQVTEGILINPGDAYLYNYDDFAATILDLYPDAGLRGDTALKINIKVADGMQRDVIKTAVYQRLWRDGVFFADLAYRPGGLPGALAERLSQEGEPQVEDREDFIAIIHRLHFFLKKSSYMTLVLLLDRPRDRVDARFIDYLPDAPGPGSMRWDVNMVVICFDTSTPGEEFPSLDFHLELNEKPVNYLEPYLPPSSEPVSGHLGMPEPEYGKGALPEQKMMPDPTANASALVRAFRLQEAREYILEFTTGNVPRGLGLKLELAEIYKWERDHEKLGLLLEAVEGDLPIREDGRKEVEEQWNRFHYLSLLQAEREGKQELADTHRAGIDSEWYGKCAEIRLSDRLIYGGELDLAETLLTELQAYFHSHGSTVLEIETRSQLAKLYRERNQPERAEKFYRNLFIKSEMMGFSLLSAGLAVDLGNLYLDRDMVNPAEVWYRRALTLYQTQRNRSGIVLVKSNLVDILIIKGKWQEAKEHLEITLGYYKKNKALLAMAVDYFNIARLEYLKRNFSEALTFIGTAAGIFEESRATGMLAEARLLELMILHLRNPDREIDFGSLNRWLPNNPGLFWTEDRLDEALAEVTPVSLQFQLTVLLLNMPRYRSPVLAGHLKKLSIELGRGGKNYYYYEYYYTDFHGLSCPGAGTDSKERENRDRCFTDAYYFFLKNHRRMWESVILHKEEIDRKASGYNVFESARMVEESLNWKIPEDFFNSLVNQLRRELPDRGESLELVKLVIRDTESDEETEPLFNLTTTRQFDILTDEMEYYARRHSEHLDLDPEEIRRHREFTSPEKVFYSYPATRVMLWKLSEKLYSVLVLAFSHEEFRGYDVMDRHGDLLSRFAALILRYYEKDYRLSRKLDFMIGESPAVQELKGKISRVSGVDFSLLIRGESGSGKELVAKGVHLLSRRARQAFVPVNAAAIPENLLEAELFGYKKGAFTGAAVDRPGLVEAAHKGTLFLDEIADLPLQLQAKLLRVLQEKEIRRVGEHKARPVDIRLISATNKDLKEMIREGRFREDLYFRLGDLNLRVPPLRERLEDIPLLVSHFLEKYGFDPGIDGAVLRRITQYFLVRGHTHEWTGNVRELESGVKRLITFFPEFERNPDSVAILDTDLETGTGTYSWNSGAGLKDARMSLERLLILHTLKINEWNKVETASALRITRQGLFKLMNKHGIPLNKSGSTPNDR